MKNKKRTISIPAEHHDYLKYMFGPETDSLSKLADSLHNLANHYQLLHDQGAKITQEVYGGHIFYEVPEHTIEVDGYISKDGKPQIEQEDEDFPCPLCYTKS